MVNKEKLTLLQQRVGYHFRDLALLNQALTHRSAHRKHNERLEFLGDAVLGSVIANQLYQQFPKADEGQLTRLRASLVRGKALAELAKELSFSEFLILGSGELKSGGFRRESILSDTFEAIIGAVLLDAGYSIAKEYILNLYREKLSKISLEKVQKDPKTRLQEWLQARGYDTPNYEVVRSKGKDHEKLYWVSCKIGHQNIIVEGKGASQRKAEQDAAEQTLEKISNTSKNQ